MRFEEIEKVLLKKLTANPTVQINFKSRSSIKGIFIKTSDYMELSRKNLWRIVSESNISTFNKTGDESLARIFNGTDFTRLELVKEPTTT